MLLDDLLFGLPRLRRAMSRLVPDRTVRVSLLGRELRPQPAVRSACHA